MVAPPLLGCVLVLVLDGPIRVDTQIIPQILPLAGWEPATFGGIISFQRFSVGILDSNLSGDCKQLTMIGIRGDIWPLWRAQRGDTHALRWA